MIVKPKIRVSAFIDGFNLYHAIDELARDDLKWINLWRLMQTFTKPSTHEIASVYYFTAIAEWLKEPAKRHKAFIAAQIAQGVTPVLGYFKQKDKDCHQCRHAWIEHEEKQTDVNIAVWLVREAFNNQYDQALIVTQDGDLAPALQVVSELPKDRKIKVIAPPGLRHSKELGKYARKRAAIKVVHLENCRLPENVIDLKTGHVVAIRPAKYDPPGSN